MVKQGEGLTRVESRHSMDETVRRVQEVLESKGVQIFAIVDHRGEAAKVGLTMRPTKVLIFGSPKGGTPLMQAAFSTAIDLPLKALVAEDEAGKPGSCGMMWNTCRARHGFPPGTEKEHRASQCAPTTGRGMKPILQLPLWTALMTGLDSYKVSHENFLFVALAVGRSVTAQCADLFHRLHQNPQNQQASFQAGLDPHLSPKSENP